MVLQRTLIIVKPDGVRRGLIGEILSRFERKGFKIVALKMLWLTREQAEELYSPHKGKHFYEDLVKFMTSGPIVAAVIEGDEAVAVVRRMVGATDGRLASPGTIRGDYSLSKRENVIHAADSVESAIREISILFKDDEILSW